MKYKDYSRKKILYEAHIDIMFLPNDKKEYSEIITMWIGDFEAIMDLVGLNEEGMYTALAFHYQVDTPWEDKEDEPWEVNELGLSLNQLLDVKHLLNIIINSPFLSAISKQSRMCQHMGKVGEIKQKQLLRPLKRLAEKLIFILKGSQPMLSYKRLQNIRKDMEWNI